MTEQDALIEHLRDEELAAIREHDGGQPRDEADEECGVACEGRAVEGE